VTDVSDEEWSFVVPYLTLIRLDSEQREHDLRAVFNALRWLVRSGAHWRMMPHDFPPWAGGVSADATVAASRLL
jgi:transposase